MLGIVLNAIYNSLVQVSAFDTVQLYYVHHISLYRQLRHVASLNKTLTNSLHCLRFHQS